MVEVQPVLMVVLVYAVEVMVAVCTDFVLLGLLKVVAVLVVEDRLCLLCPTTVVMVVSVFLLL